MERGSDALMKNASITWFDRSFFEKIKLREDGLE